MADSDKLSLFKRVDNFVRGVANGMTFGVADDIAAAADTVLEGGGRRGETIGQAFRRNAAEEQAKTKQAYGEGQEFKTGAVVGSLVTAWRVFRLGGGSYKELKRGPPLFYRPFAPAHLPKTAGGLTVAVSPGILEKKFACPVGQENNAKGQPKPGC